MKLNKSKNKGKVHPSPSSSSSSSSSNDQILSHLLPTAILTLISVLSLQDREVLAYLITHSLKSSSSSSFEHKSITPNKKTNKKTSSSSSLSLSSSNNTNHNHNHNHNHKSPSFDCSCFDCFSGFWHRWNSSPHRELIDQAIEAFEEHLASTEKHKPKNKNNPKNGGGSSSKRREKMGCSSPAADVEERGSTGFATHPPPDVAPAEERESNTSPEKPVACDVEERESEEWVPVTGVVEEEGVDVEERESGAQKKLLQQQQQQHKGLARKVLPDVIGLFNSRLWNLWGPNV